MQATNSKPKVRVGPTVKVKVKLKARAKVGTEPTTKSQVKLDSKRKPEAKPERKRQRVARPAASFRQERPATSTRSDVRARLLDAAELLFADRGYADCTFRVISERTSINQGLLHYYFGSKENLFSEVFLRRARLVANARIAALDQAQAARGNAVIPVEAIVRAFLEPTLQMARRGAGGRAFLRIHSLLRSEPGDIGLALRREAFGPSTQRFVEALCNACPHLPRSAVCWRFNFMVGSYLVVTSQGGRLDDYSDHSCSASNVTAALKEIVPFVVAGFEEGAARGSVPANLSRSPRKQRTRAGLKPH